MSEPLLELRGVRKHYPVARGLFARGGQSAVKAVDGIDLAVRPGETVGLIGESGCGKSTAARLLLRLEDPTEGRILFKGDDITDVHGPGLAPYRRAVQAVFQDPFSSLNPRRKVRDAVAEPLVAAGGFTKEEIDRKVASLLQTVGLPADSAERLPHEFSGGQRQRIAIARGLALDPELLILDEPVSALDVSIRAQILNLMIELQERLGIAYFMISHDLEIVAHMCDRVAVMYLGKIVESGPAHQVIAHPAHPYTQALVSSILPPHPDRQHERIRLMGPIPSPINPPSGCVFRTRCRLAQDVCAQQAPPLVRSAPAQIAACHFAEGERVEEPREVEPA